MVVAIVTIMLIPQSPACALPAGLPAQGGLYASMDIFIEATGPGFQETAITAGTMMRNRKKEARNCGWQNREKRGSDRLLSRRPLKNLKPNNFKKGARYVYRKSFHYSTIELERGVVHQLPHGIRQ